MHWYLLIWSNPFRTVMESEDCKTLRFNSILNFLFPVNFLVFCFFKIHLVLSSYLNLSLSQWNVLRQTAASRSWSGCLPETISWNSVATRVSRLSRCIGLIPSALPFEILYTLFFYMKSTWPSQRRKQHEGGQTCITKIENLTVVTKNSVGWT
jgi:hypothetical protein